MKLTVHSYTMAKFSLMITPCNDIDLFLYNGAYAGFTFCITILRDLEFR